jgi:hypothetical protein
MSRNWKLTPAALRALSKRERNASAVSGRQCILARRQARRQQYADADVHERHAHLFPLSHSDLPRAKPAAWPRMSAGLRMQREGRGNRRRRASATLRTTRASKRGSRTPGWPGGPRARLPERSAGGLSPSRTVGFQRRDRRTRAQVLDSRPDRGFLLIWNSLIWGNANCHHRPRLDPRYSKSAATSASSWGREAGRSM